MFKEKAWKNFKPGHFVVPLYIEKGVGTWSVDSSEGDTYNFFRLSPSDKPEERAEFIQYCLADKDVFKKLESTFGKDSAICRWVREQCPISFTINK
ncbi:hypothetical protein J7E71_17935 [Mesobacillus foraminis]|uniref:hypothetical protein n=1 Tax=Mesobacillus foraminis TaxID=279826 RepID=UPI001BEB0642|nr:hypothetical protein [Mesobacillus foraminis]MBT2757768.1 hypothetical protein [Mesobacillus foraminis]